MRQLIILIASLILVATAYPVTIHVPGDQPTIQAGINGAVNGDTVLVAPGEYLEHLTLANQSIVLKSVAGEANTAIIGNAMLTPLILFPDNSLNNSRIEGFALSSTVNNAVGVFVGHQNSPTIANCTFSDIGDAMAVFCDGQTGVTVDSCTFLSEGVFATHTDSLNIRWSTFIFSDAPAETERPITVWNSRNVRLMRNIISGYNYFEPGSHHGVIFLYDVVNASVTNNTIAGNTDKSMSENWAALRIYSCDTVDIRNNIISHNRALYGVQVLYGSVILTEYNNVFSNSLGDYDGIAPGTGSLSADPLFVDTSSNDYGLSRNSPCIDAGDPAPEYYDPDDTRNDMGAFYYDQAGRAESFSILNEVATNVVNHYPVFSWQYVNNESNPQIAIIIQVGTDRDWLAVESWDSDTLPYSDTSITYNGTALLDGQDYFSRIKLFDGIRWGLWYFFDFRMNSVPSVPVLLYPTDGGVTGSFPTLWIENSVDAKGDSLTYDFYGFHDTDCIVGGPIDMIDVPEEPDSTGAQIDSALGENCTHWWRARAFDGYEYSEWSLLETFYVDGVSEPPTIPQANYPPDTAGTPVYDMLPIFVWSQSFDPDPFDTVRYKLDIAMDSNFVFAVAVDSLPCYSYTLVDSLGFNTHYWWRVTAFDRTDLSSQSMNQPDFWTWTLGDVDHSHVTDIGDLTRLVDYLFITYTPIYPLKVGDVNGDCIVDIGDLTRMIDYLFLTFTPLEVGCE